MRDVHDNLLPDGVVGHVADRLLLVRHGLSGVDNILEHGSLPTRGEHGGSPIGRIVGGVGVRGQEGGWCSDLSILQDLLEVERQVGGNDAHIKQVLYVFKLALLEVAEDVELLQRDINEQEELNKVYLSHSLPLNMCNVFYLIAHQRLAVLQMVSLHDGRAMEFGQRMSAPVLAEEGGLN